MKKLLVIATLIVYTAIPSTNVIEAAEMNNTKIETTLHEHRFLTRGKTYKKGKYEYCTYWCKCGKSQTKKIRFTWNEKEVERELEKLLEDTNSYNLDKLSNSIFENQSERKKLDDHMKIGDVLVFNGGEKAILVKRNDQNIIIAENNENGNIRIIEKPVMFLNTLDYYISRY
jgi:hypothetical protein